MLLTTADGQMSRDPWTCGVDNLSLALPQSHGPVGPVLLTTADGQMPLDPWTHAAGNYRLCVHMLFLYMAQRIKDVSVECFS